MIDAYKELSERLSAAILDKPDGTWFELEGLVRRQGDQLWIDGLALREAAGSSLVDVTAANAGGDLLGALIDEIRIMPKPWPALSENDQGEVIERLRKRITALVRAAVGAIAADGRVSIGAEIEVLRVKSKEIKVLLNVPKNTGAKGELIDSVGSQITLVLTDAAQYLGGIGATQPDPAQRQLDLAADEVIRRARGEPPAASSPEA